VRRRQPVPRAWEPNANRRCGATEQSPDRGEDEHSPSPRGFLRRGQDGPSILPGCIHVCTLFNQDRYQSKRRSQFPLLHLWRKASRRRQLGARSYNRATHSDHQRRFAPSRPQIHVGTGSDQDSPMAGKPSNPACIRADHPTPSWESADSPASRRRLTAVRRDLHFPGDALCLRRREVRLRGGAGHSPTTRPQRTQEC
jgi:hypothetical protein